MHELSIAQNILDIIRQHVPDAEQGLLTSVKLRVGEQAGIVVDSLLFSWEAITAGTPIEAARLDIEPVPFTLRCRDCGAATAPAEGTIICEACGSIATEITGGTELSVVQLELADPAGEDQS